MAGNDREPIGRKGKPTRPVKQKVSRRRYEDDDDYDDYDGNDREPIGRKGKPTRPVKQKVSRRRYEDDDDYDDYDDYEDEEPMPRTGKGKGRKPRGNRGWLWLLLNLAIVFAVMIAIYGVYLDQKSRSRIDGKVWQLHAAVYARMGNL